MTDENNDRFKELAPLLILLTVLACLAVGISLGYRMARGLGGAQASEPVRIAWETSSPATAQGSESPLAISSTETPTEETDNTTPRADANTPASTPSSTDVNTISEPNLTPWTLAVTTPDQVEVGGAQVTVWDERNETQLWQGTTEPNGVVHWPQAPNEPFWVEARKSGTMRSRTWISPLDDAAGMVLYRPLRVVGHARDADSNEPITQFKVSFGQLRYDDPIDWDKANAQWIQSALGRLDVQFNEAAPGMALLLEAPGYAPYQSRLFEPDEQRVTLNALLIPDRGLRGIVVDADEQPIDEVTVYVYCRNEPTLRIHNGEVQGDPIHTSTRRRGEFRLPALHEPQFLLALHDTGMAVTSMEQFRQQERILILRPWASVNGRLTRQDQPLRDTLVVLEYPQQQRSHPGIVFTQQTATDHRGRFLFARVIPRGIRIHGKEYFLDPGQNLVISPREHKD